MAMTIELTLRSPHHTQKLAICERHSLHAEGVALAASLMSELKLANAEEDSQAAPTGDKADDGNSAVADATDQDTVAQLGGGGDDEERDDHGEEKRKLLRYCLVFGQGAAKSADWKCAIEAFQLAARLDPSCVTSPPPIADRAQCDRALTNVVCVRAIVRTELIASWRPRPCWRRPRAV
jgi:hypothetical protein